MIDYNQHSLTGQATAAPTVASEWDELNTTETISCRLCGNREFSVRLHARDFDTGKVPFELHQCRSCGLVRTEPQLPPESLGRYYDPAYYGGKQSKFNPVIEALTRLSNQRLAKHILRQLHGADQRAGSNRYDILDIGCGRGNLLKALASKGHRCQGVEREGFKTSNGSGSIRYHFGNLGEIGFNDSSFDAVIMWHTLEHMEDPVLYMNETLRILKPGGIFALAVPNLDSFQARMFKSDWFHLDLPRHTYHFGMRWLSSHLAGSGFRIAHTSTCSVTQNVYGFIQSTLNRWTGTGRNNVLYGMLKSSSHSGSQLERAGWLLLAAMLSPPGILEYAVSGISRRGATAIIFAVKP